MAQRLERAAGRHQAHLEQVRRKAETENQKVHEVGFILQVQNQAKRHEISRRLEEGDRRREAALDSIRAKATSIAWRKPAQEDEEGRHSRTPPRMTIGSFLAARNSASRSVGGHSAASAPSGSRRRRASSGAPLGSLPGDGSGDERDGVEEEEEEGRQLSGPLLGGFAPGVGRGGAETGGALGLLGAQSGGAAGGLLGALEDDGKRGQTQGGDRGRGRGRGRETEGAALRSRMRTEAGSREPTGDAEVVHSPPLSPLTEGMGLGHAPAPPLLDSM